MTLKAIKLMGFAALNMSDEKLVQDGEKKDIELGAVLWVKFETWQTKK
jgi:cobalt/nickel transport protein